MSTEKDIEGPVILWSDNGAYEGWSPRSYPSVVEALMAERYSGSFVITRLIDPRKDELK